MLDYSQHFDASLSVFGETIQTPVGEMQAIVRTRRDLEFLKVKGRGIEIDRDHTRLFLHASNAALLQEGQSITARGQSFDLGKPTPYNGYTKFILVESQITSPAHGPWR